METLVFSDWVHITDYWSIIINERLNENKIECKLSYVYRGYHLETTEISNHDKFKSFAMHYKYSPIYAIMILHNIREKECVAFLLRRKYSEKCNIIDVKKNRIWAI